MIASGKNSEHQKSLCPPVKQVAAGGAQPGEVREFDLPLVRPQAKGGFPTPAQWIRGLQTQECAYGNTFGSMIIPAE